MITETINTHIRWVIRRDLPYIIAIEKACYSEPWTQEDFETALRQRNCIGLIAESGDEILGYMLYHLHKESLELINFAVDPNYRRYSIGSQMVNHLKGKLSNNKRTYIDLITRETNLISQLFFKAQNFRAIEVLRKFYEDTDEDGYLMRYNIGNI